MTSHRPPPAAMVACLALITCLFLDSTPARAQDRNSLRLTAPTPDQVQLSWSGPWDLFPVYCVFRDQHPMPWNRIASTTETEYLDTAPAAELLYYYVFDPPTGGSCDRCNADSECTEPNTFCRYAGGNCAPPGWCTSRGGGGCEAIYVPVCGCDGLTYGNDCEARLAGASIASGGECPGPECNDNSECQPGRYCRHPDGACSAPGTCEPPGDPEWECETAPEICGCDGQSYANWCAASQAGVSVAHEGPC